MNTPDSEKVFWQDWLFWLALSFGPICWIVLYLQGASVRDGAIAIDTLILIILVYPVLEEFVFRGSIQATLFQYNSLRRSIAGISAANVVTSILFSVTHLINQPPLWAALVFFPSLVFGWMRDRFGKISACIVLHVFYNAGFLLLFSS